MLLSPGPLFVDISPERSSPSSTISSPPLSSHPVVAAPLDDPPPPLANVESGGNGGLSREASIFPETEALPPVVIPLLGERGRLGGEVLSGLTVCWGPTNQKQIKDLFFCFSHLLIIIHLVKFVLEAFRDSEINYLILSEEEISESQKASSKN